MRDEPTAPVAPEPSPAHRAAAARPPTGWTRAPGAPARPQTLAAALLCRLGAACVAVLRWRFRRAADVLDREYPGPYAPGSYGAEVKAFTARLRAFPLEPGATS